MTFGIVNGYDFGTIVCNRRFGGLADLERSGNIHYEDEMSTLHTLGTWWDEPRRSTAASALRIACSLHRRHSAHERREGARVREFCDVYECAPFAAVTSV